MRFRLSPRDIPGRLATGAFILHSGLEKWHGPVEQAEAVVAQTQAQTHNAQLTLSRAQALLRSRYRQLEAMEIGQLPVIVIRIERVASWGDLA